MLTIASVAPAGLFSCLNVFQTNFDYLDTNVGDVSPLLTAGPNKPLLPSAEQSPLSQFLPGVCSFPSLSSTKHFAYLSNLLPWRHVRLAKLPADGPSLIDEVKNGSRAVQGDRVPPQLHRSTLLLLADLGLLRDLGHS